MIRQLKHTYFPSSSCEKGAAFYYSQSLLVSRPMRIRCIRRSQPGPCTKVSVTESTTSKVPIPFGANKISRAVRRDAQAALFDYLCCTRGLSFVDAEHISKNSPRFLEDLLSKIKKEEDVMRALSRFLRYHPVNEFEPFFESLGLSPNDIASLLPQNLIFLSDDCNLLDNYHVLCHYGIPYSKIGKMYKEATEIFTYGDGVLDMKLRAYEQLGLCQSTVGSLVSCCPTLLVGGTNNEFFVVLEKLKELGFGSGWIGSCLSSKYSYNWSRVLDTMCFLDELGYSDAQMGTLFKENPALLFEGKRTYLLVGQLVKLGLSRNAIYSVFLEYPKILTSKYAKRLWEAICFLLEIGIDTENIAKIVSTNVRLIGSHSLERPRSVLKNFKGDRHCLYQSIQEDPMNLIRLASKWEIKSMKQTTNLASSLEKKAFLLRLGYVENSVEMTKALSLVKGRGDHLQDRFNCLVEAGLERIDVINMFRQDPSILNHTKKQIQKKIESLRKYLGYPVESVVQYPIYFTYSKERIDCRFSMYAWAKKQGAAKPMLSVSTLLACSDTRFVKHFVNVHPEGPAMWESLKKSFCSS